MADALRELGNVIAYYTQPSALIPPVSALEGTAYPIENGSFVLFENSKPDLFRLVSESAEVFNDLAADERPELLPFELDVDWHPVKHPDDSRTSHDIRSLCTKSHTGPSIVGRARHEFHAGILK
ncbi:MAG: hypothetical protein ACLPKT_21540 [Methylocella sp.]